MSHITGMTKGIVIDHISPGWGLKLFEYLDLYKVDYRVAVIMNAKSEKYGSKDIIKIENEIDIDLTMLGFIDPNITVNIIKEEEIVEKINLSLPDRVEGIINCQNPRCITSDEKDIVESFILIDEDDSLYKCEYCNQIYSWENENGIME